MERIADSYSNRLQEIFGGNAVSDEYMIGELFRLAV